MTKVKGKNVLWILSSIALILALGIVFVVNSNNSKEEVIVNASWTTMYESVEELTENSDFIGLVEIQDVVRTETRTSGLKGDDTELYATIYSAIVLDGIVSDDDSIEIIMTGKNDKQEVADDPLMSRGEKWFLFARENDSGTYTILSGPYGRYSYNEKNDTITSLNLVDSSVARANPYIDINLYEVSIADIKGEIASYLND